MGPRRCFRSVASPPSMPSDSWVHWVWESWPVFKRSRICCEARRPTAAPGQLGSVCSSGRSARWGDRAGLSLVRSGPDAGAGLSGDRLDAKSQPCGGVDRRAVRAACAGHTAHRRGWGRGWAIHPAVCAGLAARSLRARRRGTRTSLFPVVGTAAFLGAGYRTPIAGIVFVAEVTGRPGFVVPALIATAVAQVLMGASSVTTYQPIRRPTRPDAAD